jgi:hypothetical protein
MGLYNFRECRNKTVPPALAKLLAELLRLSGQYAHDLHSQAQDLAHGWFTGEPWRIFPINRHGSSFRVIFSLC